MPNLDRSPAFGAKVVGLRPPSDAQILAHFLESGSIEGSAFALNIHPSTVSQLKLQHELRQVKLWMPRG